MKSQISNTPFQMRVYDATREIPRGRVTTYALLAMRIGCRSARAVGQALRRNPYAPKVPCHRVIASNLSIGGFNGKTAGPLIKKKLELLAREGVVFKNGRLSDNNHLFRFAENVQNAWIVARKRQQKAANCIANENMLQ